MNRTINYLSHDIKLMWDVDVYCLRYIIYLLYAYKSVNESVL